MRYFDYYNVLRLKNVTRKGLGFSALFIALFVIQLDLFFSDIRSIELGISFYFLLTVFITSMYAYQMKNDASSIVFQLPISAKDRVKNDYIGVIVNFLIVTVFFAVLAIIIIFVLSNLFPPTDSETNSDSISTAGGIYALAYNLLIFGLFMPLSYISAGKFRLYFGLLFYLIITILNFITTWIVTGKIFSTGDIRILIDQSPVALLISLIFLALSIVVMFFSIIKSLKLNSYEWFSYMYLVNIQSK